MTMQESGERVKNLQSRLVKPEEQDTAIDLKDENEYLQAINYELSKKVVALEKAIDLNEKKISDLRIQITNLKREAQRTELARAKLEGKVEAFEMFVGGATWKQSQ